MKTSKELHALTLGCLVVLHFFAFPGFARPRLPAPPLPAFAPILSHFDFDDLYWHGTNSPMVQTDYGQLIESWSGYALVRSGVMLKPFVVSAVDSGHTNLATDSGAVRFWFKPYWSSVSLPNGTGPGSEATLLDLIVLGDNDIISAWSFRFSADGTALILSEGETELMRADVAWPAGAWHCLALNYGPQETALFLDGELIAKGAGVVSVAAPSAGLVVGSTGFGTNAADGEFDEVCTFARPLQDFDLGLYALSYTAIAARGPISEEEEAGAKHQQQPESAMNMVLPGGPPTLLCAPGGPAYLTNVTCAITTNLGVVISFDITGGTNGLLYDIFAATNLLGNNITNSPWTWLGQGFTCNRYSLTNQPVPYAFYVLGTPQDTDYDGLPDAFERLTSKTNPSNPDTDGDGMIDSWELFYGFSPTNAADGAGDANGNGISNTQEYLNEQALLRPREPLGPCSRRTPLVISEIMYNPAPGGSEFVEIYNSHHLPQKLDGFMLLDPEAGIGGTLFYTFTNNVTLAPRSFTAVTPTISLPGSSKLQLRNAQGAVLLEVNYSDNAPWPKETDGAGHSLVLARPSFGENDPRAWSASEWRGGSRGFAETNTFHPLRYIKINEFLANPAGTNVDFIELYNTAPVTIDIGGCLLDCANTFNSAYVIPPGTVIGPRGFVSWLAIINLSSSGESIFFASPGTNRILDAVGFPAQAEGLSSGRFPDGAPGFQELSVQTRGTNNAPPLTRDIVINEIMYNPISGTNRDEYVELYNRGTNPVTMSNWTLSGGISFTIPNFTLATNHYLVIANNASNLLARYPAGQLVLGTNLLGNYPDSLGNRGDRVTLRSSSPGSGAVVDEVVYGDGGRWGRWSDGGGSSLELIHSRADNRLAPNWADSDESAKSAWTAITNRGILDLGAGTADSIEIFLDGMGECLVDNVIATSTNGANHATNGTFEAGLAGWKLQGTHRLSGLASSSGLGGFNGTQGLHLRATSRGDLGPNKVSTLLDSVRPPGVTNTIGAQARWLRGKPEIIFRYNGNWLQAAGSMAVPSNLGTPGLPNSRAVAQPGPAITEVTHLPVLPAASQTVAVSARASSPDGVTNIVLKYRLDPSLSYSSAAMVDTGTNGDSFPGDGLYTARIPGQASGQLVAFYIEAADGSGVTNGFPSDAPVRECLVRFGEGQPAGTIGTYRLWLTKTNQDLWTNREKLSNEPLDCTFVYGNQRAVYNAGALYSGSAHTSLGYSGPTNKICGYKLEFPSDERFLGATDCVLDWPVRDRTGQREQLGYWLASQLGLQFHHRRFVHVVVNGMAESSRPLPDPEGTKIYEDVQQPGGDTVDQWFPTNTDGHLYKFDVWIEFTANSTEIGTLTYPTTRLFQTTNPATGQLEKNQGRYRVFYRERADQSNPDNLTNLLKLVEGLNTNSTDGLYITQMEALLDTEQWMRVFALNDALDNSDSFGNYGGKNMFAYKPLGDKWRLLIWDLDLGLGDSESCSPQPDPEFEPIFYNFDTNTFRLEGHPPFRRAWYRAIEELTTGPMGGNSFLPVLAANYVELTNNGVSALSPFDVPTNHCYTSPLDDWINERRQVLTNELAAVATTFAITNNGGANFTTNATNVLLGGTAPVRVATIRINSTTSDAPVTWATNFINWTVTVQLTNGANPLTVRGYDRLGVSNAVDTITITRPP